MKQNRHSLMAKGIMVLLALLVLVFIFTYAWFIDANAPVSANGLRLSTSSGADFDMAIGFSSPYTGGEYVISEFTNDSGGAIDFEKLVIPQTLSSNNQMLRENAIYSTQDNPTFNLLESFQPIDLTGNGSVLYRPNMTAKNRAIDFTADRVNYDVEANRQYISFDLYVRSETQGMKVKLDKNSYVVAACEVSDDSLENLAEKITSTPPQLTVGAEKIGNTKLRENVNNRYSKYSTAPTTTEFSEDSVIGAVRIGFTDYNDTAVIGTFFGPATATYSMKTNPSLLWIPRSDIYLQDTATAAANDWKLVTSSDTSGTLKWTDPVDFLTTDDSEATLMSRTMANVLASDITYKDAASQHWYYDVTKISKPNPEDRFTQVDSAISDIESASDTTIITLSDDIFDGKYYYGKCHINLWIEGCDAEARKAIDGGSFFFGFDLTGN